MRILLANKYNFPKGGADKYYLFLKDAWEKAGHKVAVFAMEHPDNLPSPWSKYFVSNIDFHGSFKDKLRSPGRIIYSFEAKRKFAALLDDFKPDIVHFHNIYHQISPSVLPEVKKRRLPAIMHLHDYKLFCPNYLMYAGGQICQNCLDQKGYCPCFWHNCYSSRPRSALAVLEMALHHKLWKIYEKNLDCLIAPSRFMADLAKKAGWKNDQVELVYNPAPEVSETNVSQEDGAFLYFGRLSQEKGIEDLLAAAKLLKTKVDIAGQGPLEENIKTSYRPEIQSGQIRLLGQLAGDGLKKAITEAKAIIIPSRWPENMPLALLESLAKSKIVIASRRGGLPEVIRDEENGYLFEPGNIKALAEKLKMIEGLDKEKREKIKEAAKQSALNLGAKEHLDKIMKIYQKLAKKPG